MSTKKVLEKVLTESPNQREIVLLSVFLLGGDKKSIDTEDIAVKCFAIAPSLFAWSKFPNQINIETVRIGLSDCKKEKNGGLLLGSGREGWRLSSKGLEWAKTRGKELLAARSLKVDTSRISAGSIDTVRKAREKKRVLLSAAWNSWMTKKTMTLQDAKSIFRIDEYTTEKMLKIKVTRLQSLLGDDKEVAPFIQEAARLVQLARA
jgi:hypothetical protein